MKNGNQLPLGRCPYCSVAKPLLTQRTSFETANHSGQEQRLWVLYSCATCGGVVLTSAPTGQNTDITEMWPPAPVVADTVPARAKDFLTQAMASLHAPAGAVMLTASAVDAMLKDKSYKEGTLNSRIGQAAKDHLITLEMAAWAHEIRLEANDQRHADETAPLPSEADARKVIEFANALAQFLYVLPARVERGRKA